MRGRCQRVNQLVAEVFASRTVERVRRVQTRGSPGQVDRSPAQDAAGGGQLERSRVQDGLDALMVRLSPQVLVLVRVRRVRDEAADGLAVDKHLGKETVVKPPDPQIGAERIAYRPECSDHDNLPSCLARLTQG